VRKSKKRLREPTDLNQIMSKGVLVRGHMRFVDDGDADIRESFQELACGTKEMAGKKKLSKCETLEAALLEIARRAAKEHICMEQLMRSCLRLHTNDNDF
jgi:hypothetical protein